jgi:hypothetical protein
MIYYKFWGGKSFIATPLPTLTVLFVLMGTLAVMMGIVAEMVMRTYYESQQKTTYRIARTLNIGDIVCAYKENSQPVDRGS